MAVDSLTLGLGLSAALLAVLLLVLVRRRRADDPETRLRRCCADMLQDVYLPDGEDGQIHIEYALLCPRGVVIVNLKNVKGHVFGSDAMHEWAVITGEKRFGFRNPQDGLFDRMAAVKRLLPDVPVEGVVAFGRHAEFTKGTPTHVAMFDALTAELEQEFRPDHPALAKYGDDFQRLKNVATSAA